MSTVKFPAAAPTNIDKLVHKDENGNIISFDTELLPDRLESRGCHHQPIIVAVDNSGSTKSDAGNGKTKAEIFVEEINSIPTSEAVENLGPVERNSIDMCVLSFSGDDVYVESTWKPISQFEGISPLKPTSTTPFYKAVSESIQASRVMRYSYSQQGVDCVRPQIFIFTDGLATDYNENFAEAKKLCDEYVSPEKPKVKIFVVLVPGSMTDEETDSVAKDILKLSDNITILKANDCVNGLPAAFDFLKCSVVVGASSTVGAEMKAKYDPNNLSVARNTKTTGDGSIITGEQSIWVTD